MNKLFLYVKNQYLLGGFKDSDLAVLVERRVIKEEERLKILNKE